MAVLTTDPYIPVEVAREQRPARFIAVDVSPVGWCRSSAVCRCPEMALDPPEPLAHVGDLLLDGAMVGYPHGSDDPAGELPLVRATSGLPTPTPTRSTGAHHYVVAPACDAVVGAQPAGTPR